MVTKEVYELLDTLLHRIAALTGKIVKEKEAYAEAMQQHCNDLSLARNEIFEIITKMEEDNNGHAERPDSDGTR